MNGKAATIKINNSLINVRETDNLFEVINDEFCVLDLILIVLVSLQICTANFLQLCAMRR